MKKHLSLLIAVSFLLVQQAAAAMYSNNPATDSLEAPAAAGDNVVLLKKGMAISLRLVEAVSSEEVQPGNIVALEVYSDVIVDGKVVIATGTYAEGEIGLVRRAGIFGREARIEILPTSFKAVDGKRVTLRGKGLAKKGKSRQMLAFGAGSVLPTAGIVVMGICPPAGVALLVGSATGLFIKGGEVEIPKSTILTAVVAENVVVKA